MTKRFLRDLTPPMLWRAGAAAARRLEQREINAVPWGPRYGEAKWRCLQETLDDRATLDRFRTGAPLPAGFGIGIDERCVEYPWMFSRLDMTGARILDAGSVLNHAFLLNRLRPANQQLHILTLAPEETSFFSRGVSYLYEDLRTMPMRTGTYQSIVCLSTLEHVGCDNTFHTGDSAYAEDEPDDYLTAVRELSRVLAPDGNLLLSVPFGKRSHHGSFRQFDQEMLSSVVEVFGPARSRTASFFRYSPEGWQVAGEESCVDCEYVDWVARAMGGAPWPDPLPVEPDRAAAARAVACLDLVKDCTATEPLAPD